MESDARLKASKGPTLTMPLWTKNRPCRTGRDSRVKDRSTVRKIHYRVVVYGLTGTVLFSSTESPIIQAIILELALIYSRRKLWTLWNFARRKMQFTMCCDATMTREATRCAEWLAVWNKFPRLPSSTSIRKTWTMFDLHWKWTSCV